MFVITDPIQLYGRKVTTDLALRSGSADANSYSRTPGLSAVVNRFWKSDSTANLEMLFQEQADFDADNKQPHYTWEEYDKNKEQQEFEPMPPYSPAKDTTDFNDYFRRLEDICSDYFEDYVANLVYTIINKRGAGGVKLYEEKHRIQPTLYSVDDNEDVTELADLQLMEDPNKWSTEARQKAIIELPYTIKRLHNLSRYCGIHMLSLIASYVTARRKNNLKRQTGSTMLLKKNAVIAECVYTCKTDGTIGKKIEVSNKNKKAEDMYNWLIGVNDDYPSYREDYHNFLHYCKVLNIDLENDDMSKYDSDFVDKLLVLTLTPDNQYNQSIYNDILNPTLVEEEHKDVYLETISTFHEVCVSDERLTATMREYDSLKASNNIKVAQELHFFYTVSFLGQTVDPNLYSWEDGFLYYNGKLVVLNTQLISNETFTLGECIISELGYIIHVSDLMSLDIMSIYVAKENMKTKYITKDADEPLSGWLRVSV